MLTKARGAADARNAVTALDELTARLGEDHPRIREIRAAREAAQFNPDAQVATIVFRGSEVRDGIARYETAYADLREKFGAFMRSGEREGIGTRLASVALFAVATFQFVHGTGDLLSQGLGAFTHPAGVFDILSTPPAFMIASGMFISRIWKLVSLDPLPGRVSEAAKPILEGASDDIFVHRSSLRTDANVVSGLLRSNLSDEVRNEAFRRLTNSFVGDVLDYMRMLESLDRIVKVSESWRYVQMHHVMYFDPVQHEPVWIFVMRSTRKPRRGPPNPSRRNSIFRTPEMNLAG